MRLTSTRRLTLPPALSDFRQLMTAVNDNFVELTIRAVIKGGGMWPTGEIGGGKIFVLPRDDCVRGVTA